MASTITLAWIAASPLRTTTGIALTTVLQLVAALPIFPTDGLARIVVGQLTAARQFFLTDALAMTVVVQLAEAEPDTKAPPPPNIQSEPVRVVVPPAKPTTSQKTSVLIAEKLQLT